MITNPFYRQVAKSLALLLVSIAITRFSQGLWLGVMTLCGIVWALQGKAGKALSMYFMIICMLGINPIILPVGRFMGILVRFGPLLIGFALTLKGISLRGQARVPLGLLTLYLAVAAVSSINGWAPMVSYLKLVNFLVFLLSFLFGVHTLSYDCEGTFYLRATFFAYAVFLIFGSAMILPFPSISTLSGVQSAALEGNLEAINAAMQSAEGTVPLFCGVTNQSQYLAVLSGTMLAWLMADMLFIEQKFSKWHLLLLGVGAILAYLTRSRVGLFTMMVGTLFVAIYLPNKMGLESSIKRRLKAGVSVILIITVIVGIASEVMNDSISQWLRKVNDVEGDRRSLSEAVTASRQGLMEESMRDFRCNPMFGMGFQVAEYTAEQIARSGGGLVISAPIEKGVLPVMVLGETGIVGAIFFAVFLISFYTATNRRRLYVTAAMFTVLLATNMGEATFFSPGGGGGVIWAISIIGGYCIDMTLSHERRPRWQMINC